MPVATKLPPFEHTLVRDLEGLFVPWQAAPASDPRLVVLNEDLARELGVDPAELRTSEGVAVLVGNQVVESSTPVALAYSGHQFGSLSPVLGDGRALLLGEVVDRHGRRRDIHLKGSGRTPFARGGDGRAALGPMLREHVVGEAMHGLGIPTTRSLAVVATGDQVPREVLLPGAVLVRVAASHLRVGTFQFAAMQGGPELVRRLADHVIARHHPAAAEAERPALALLEAVVEAQAQLIARWMLVGFVHGVMNTDNMTISGETIDYGPCAFVDAYDPSAVYSSIDLGGRYAYGNQPGIAQWNLARLAETLLPLIDDDGEAAVEAATDVLRTFDDRYEGHRLDGLRAKLGLAGAEDGDGELADGFLGVLQAQRADLTSTFRALSGAVGGDRSAVRSRLTDPAAFDAWAERWDARRTGDARSAEDVAAAMDAANPAYIPRNHLVEEALEAATAGDPAPFDQLVDAVSRPYEVRPGLERFAEPAPEAFGPYRTFCGT